MTLKMTVENALQAKKEIEKLETQGYSLDDIYILHMTKSAGKTSRKLWIQKKSA